MNHLPMDKVAERQLCARIQHFYNFLKEKTIDTDEILTPQGAKIEEKLNLLTKHFEQVFDDIVYTDQ